VLRRHGGQCVGALPRGQALEDFALGLARLPFHIGDVLSTFLRPIDLFLQHKEELLESFLAVIVFKFHGSLKPEVDALRRAGVVWGYRQRSRRHAHPDRTVGRRVARRAEQLHSQGGGTSLALMRPM